MVVEPITSTANPRIKALAKLKTARHRARTGLFLIEGYREIERAADAGVAIDSLLICRELLTGAHEAALKTAPAAEHIELAEPPFRKIALRQNPPGLIAVARRFDTDLDRLQLSTCPLVLVVERVEKPGNLGAMLRTADAVGADAVVVADAATDIFNPNVIRASQGAVFGTSLAVASTADTIAWTRAQGLQVFGGYPDADLDLWQANMTGPTAILVGAEDSGLSDAWRTIAAPVRIPMMGAADSLNASVSAAVLVFEAVRQRRSG